MQDGVLFDADGIVFAMLGCIFLELVFSLQMKKKPSLL
jgi:hypothetical protein